ncbi:MAG: hypothetical protein JWM87_710 [Candidatus Eremiobacteraeota bacterium]|nr:hypothetical protein [Candidatus Eremiobacteraeota bacterium]
MRASERSDFYGWVLDPPPSLAIVRDAHGRKAETAVEADARERRRKTMPAPKGRRRGPRGRVDDVAFHDEPTRE